MKRFAVILSLFVSLCAPLSGKYEPEVRIPKELNQVVGKGRVALRKLPRNLRWALMAETLGLCYQPKGNPAYSSKPAYKKSEQIKYYPVQKGSRFIGADGVEYGFYDVINSKNTTQNKEWITVKRAIHSAGVHAVLSGSSAEVSSLCVQTARRRLHRMPAVMQDAFLAEMDSLLYVPEGGSAYLGRKKGGLNGTDMQLEFWKISDKARFMDRTGTERSVAELTRMREKDAPTRRAWIQAMWCCQLVGQESILKEFSDELKLMRKWSPRKK